jgi:hypothetical protein
VKSENASGSGQPREGTQYRRGIGEKLQNATAHHPIEGLATPHLTHVRLHKRYIVQSSFRYAGFGPRDGPYVAFDPDDLSRRTNQTRRQHRYVANARADIQNPLTRTHACVTEQSLGVRIKARSLSNQPLLFGIGTPEHVLRSGITRGHIARNITMLDFLSASPRPGSLNEKRVVNVRSMAQHTFPSLLSRPRDVDECLPTPSFFLSGRQL